MKLRLLYILITVCYLTNSYAQDSLSFNKKYIAKNNLSIELAGVGLLYSINYERNFGIKDNSFHTLRAGINFIPPSLYDGILLPVSYSYSIGKKKSKFFVGFGLTFEIAYTPYPTTFAARQYIRHHPTQRTFTSDPNYEGYQSLINTALCPMMGYEFVSKKTFYFKTYIMGAFYRERVIAYYAYPWAGFTFGFKLKNN